MTQGQGHGVKGQGQIGSYLKNCFVFKTRMDDSILIKLIYIVDVDKKIQLTYGQGHEVKGQGQTCNYEKNFFSLLKHERRIGS